jgi:hypothetical protein
LGCDAQKTAAPREEERAPPFMTTSGPREEEIQMHSVPGLAGIRCGDIREEEDVTA